MIKGRFERTFRVYSEDVDHMGIVYHANHLKFYERARAELLRSSGKILPELKQQGIQFAIYEINIKYLKPALLDDLLSIITEYKKKQATGLLFNQQMVNQFGKLLSEVVVHVVCVNDQLKPMRLPKSFNTDS